jgi:SpoVK/Ycf46/Vps4 family AAA+-type ATPase
MPGPTRVVYNMLKDKVEAFSKEEQESERAVIAEFRRAENAALQVWEDSLAVIYSFFI